MEKTKKIAWISPAAVISTDRFIIPELSKHYDIDWIIIAWKDEKVDFEKQLAELRKQGKISYLIKRQNIKSSDPRVIFWWKSLIKELKKGKYDLIYQVMFGAPYYMPLLNLLLKKQKILIAIHNVVVPLGGSHYKMSKWYGHYTIQHFKYFHTFSKHQMQELLNIVPGKKCDYSPFVIMDYGEPKGNRSDDVITFLNFGIIRDYKRVDVLIDAAQIAYERTKQRFRVIIAGSCDNWERYSKGIKYPELFDLRIRRIEDEEVPDLFGEADYFVAPYQDIAQSGSAVVAINYDMPIIASRLPAFEEYIVDKKTGYLINPADKNDLARVISEVVVTHSEVFKQQRAEIRKWKEEHFTAEKVSHDYMRNFEEVMNS